MKSFTRFLLSQLLVVVLLFANVPLRYYIPVANLTPILIVLWAWRLDSKSMAWTTFCGAVLADFVVPDAFGTAPIIWGVLLFIARSQYTLMMAFGYPVASVICFAISFLYIIAGRLVYMAANGTWSWTPELLLQIAMASLVNLFIAPVLYLILMPAYPVQRKTQTTKPFREHAHS